MSVESLLSNGSCTEAAELLIMIDENERDGKWYEWMRSTVGKLLDDKKHHIALNLLLSVADNNRDEQWNSHMIICAYYVNRRDLALDCINRITFEKNWNIRLVSDNIKWYVGNLAERSTKINFSNESMSMWANETFGDLYKSFTPSNCSIFKHPNGFVVNIRFITYTIHSSGEYIYNTSDNTCCSENALIFLDNNMNEIRRLRVVDNRKQQYYSFIRGIEDLRITSYCSDTNTLGFVGTVVDHLPNYRNTPRICVGKIDTLTGNITESTLPKIPDEGRCEKNWSPILGTDEFIYGFGDKKITITVPNEHVFIQRSTSHKFNTSILRGSTQVITTKSDTYLTVVHEVHYDGPHSRRYIHRFIEFDKDMNLLRISNPFRFDEQSIQYIAGLCYDNDRDRYIITGSVRDRWPRMFSIPADYVESLLNKDQ